MRKLTCTAAALVAFGAGLAQADVAKVQDRSKFVELVSGKTLTLPLVKLNVSPDGTITGKGARWDVSGSWTWRDGYFCRDLVWGGDSLGYNCQEVSIENGRVRFTSDKGTGDSATFRLK